MKLTENLKKKIILEVAEGTPKTDIAKKYNISHMTINRLLDTPEGAEMLKKVKNKKELTEQDIFDYMDTQKEKVLTIMSKYLDALADDDKISSATVNQLTTALGTLIDKWTMVREKDTNAEVRLAYIVEQDAPEAPPKEVEDEIIDE